jgi:hypothetical protein
MLLNVLLFSLHYWVTSPFKWQGLPQHAYICNQTRCVLHHQGRKAYVQAPKQLGLSSLSRAEDIFTGNQMTWLL